MQEKYEISLIWKIMKIEGYHPVYVQKDTSLFMITELYFGKRYKYIPRNIQIWSC